MTPPLEEENWKIDKKWFIKERIRLDIQSIFINALIEAGVFDDTK